MQRLAIEPRGLDRVTAARYVGIGPTLFDLMVHDGRMPKPRIINARRVWDRRELDIAFDALPNGEETAQDANPFDKVAV